jgi:hypothetical protein
MKEDGSHLICRRCALSYPIREGIPVLMRSEAIPLQKGHPVSEPSVRLARATFRVIRGPDKEMSFQLESATCRAIGRGTTDPDQTSVFQVDLTLALDESTRGIILRYIAAQFARAAREQPSGEERLGSFRRASDVLLTDGSLSRPHAMIFSDGERIAILDLVSKNGTCVNGREVESAMLARGDVIELGDSAIAIES